MAQWGLLCSCTAGVQAAPLPVRETHWLPLATYMGLRLELGAVLGAVCYWLLQKMLSVLVFSLPWCGWLRVVSEAWELGAAVLLPCIGKLREGSKGSLSITWGF